MKNFIKKELDRIIKNIHNKKIIILAGGKSAESRGSLEDAPVIAKVLKHYARAVSIINPEVSKENMIKIFSAGDILYFAMYGGYGEDGRLQGLAEIFGKRYTGSGSLTSAIGMNKYFFNYK